MKIIFRLNSSISWLAKAICVYLLSIPFDFIPVGSFGSISKVIVFLPLVAILLNIHSINPSGKKLLPFVCFLLVGFFSSLLSVHPSAISNWFSLFLNISLIALMLCFNYSDVEYNAIETSILVSGIILCGSFFVFNFTGETGRQGINMMGAGQNYNYLCGYLLLPQATCLKRTSKQKNKTLYSILLAIMIVVVLLSGSRGGLLASVGLIGFYLLARLHNKSISLSRKFIYLISFVVLGVALFILFEWIVPAGLRTRYSVQSIIDDKGSNRFLIWESLLKSYAGFGWLEKLFGVGVGTSRFYSYNGTYAAHNVFLAYLLECGLVGVLIFIGILIRLGYLSIKKHRFSQFSALIGFIIMSMTTTFTNFKPMWVLFFYSIISINKQSNAAETAEVGSYDQLETG